MGISERAALNRHGQSARFRFRLCAGNPGRIDVIKSFWRRESATSAVSTQRVERNCSRAIGFVHPLSISTSLPGETRGTRYAAQSGAGDRRIEAVHSVIPSRKESKRSKREASQRRSQATINRPLGSTARQRLRERVPSSPVLMHVRNNRQTQSTVPSADH